jgi:hypothetical protein
MQQHHLQQAAPWDVCTMWPGSSQTRHKTLVALRAAAAVAAAPLQSHRSGLGSSPTPNSSTAAAAAAAAGGSRSDGGARPCVRWATNRPGRARMAPSIDDYRGVRQQRLGGGSWCAEIRDLKTKHRVWLGKCCCGCAPCALQCSRFSVWWCGCRHVACAAAAAAHSCCVFSGWWPRPCAVTVLQWSCCWPAGVDPASWQLWPVKAHVVC